jgi:probable rRNA maturation factor
LEIQVSGESSAGVSKDWLRSAVSLVLQSAGLDDGEISLTLLDDDSIRELHRTYLGKDVPTDVISFALHEGDEAVLGDVYVGYEQAAMQAAEAGISVEEELARLSIHGTLHVLGYDHPDTEARSSSEMFVLQEHLVRKLLDEAI